MNKEYISHLVREEMKNYILPQQEEQIDESFLLGAAIGLAAGFTAGAVFTYNLVVQSMRRNFLVRMFSEKYLKEHLKELEVFERKSKVMSDAETKAEGVRALDKMYEKTHELKKNLPTYLAAFEQDYNGKQIPKGDIDAVQKLLDGIIASIEKVKKQTNASNWTKLASVMN